MINRELLVSVTDIESQELWELEDEEEIAAARELAGDAAAWFAAFPWVLEIVEISVGFAMPGVLGVFLVEINPARVDVDCENWVIFGSIPPAYISPEFAATAIEALSCYVAEAQAWVEAVEEGDSLGDIMPIDLTPTLENAKALKNRLTFIEEKILADD